MESGSKKKIYKRWWFWVIIGIIIIGIYGNSEGENNESKADDSKNTLSTTLPNKDEPKKVEQKKEDYIKAGMYKVGTDIQHGEYVIVSDDDMCYFQVSKDSSGTLESIVCNDNITTRSYITINDGEYLTVTDGKIYPIGKEPKVEAKNGQLAEGMYKVGVEIKAGEYKVAAQGEGYVEVSKDSRHLIYSIITNDNFAGEKYITIKDGNYIKLSGASLIVK